MRSVLAAGARVLIPEVVDYELRRELIRANKAKGLARLDTMVSRQGTLPVDSRSWIRAAELWAEVRKAGKPTASTESLDGDVILAAVAQIAAEDGSTVVVVTGNVNHLNRFVGARDWRTMANPIP